MRPEAPTQRSSGTSGGGCSAHGLYRCARVWRRRWRRCSKPSVATKAVRAPRRSRSALVAIVVPCVKRSTSVAPTATAADSTDSSWRARVGTFAVRNLPSATRTASVNVPPTSIPRARTLSFSSKAWRVKLPVHVDRLVCLGVSHRTAPVELRERFGTLGLGADRCPEIDEHAVLATCYRVELYAYLIDGVEEGRDVLIDELAEAHGVDRFALVEHLYVHAG